MCNVGNSKSVLQFGVKVIAFECKTTKGDVISTVQKSCKAISMETISREHKIGKNDLDHEKML